jgi:hypothetical protein
LPVPLGVDAAARCEDTRLSLRGMSHCPLDDRGTVRFDLVGGGLE